MTLSACPLCGTQTIPGTACLNCGTPTPAPHPELGATSAESLPPTQAAGSSNAETQAPQPYTTQWEAIFEKLRRVTAPKYKVRSILGYGGMAGVYLADEPRLGRKVAIKVMSPGLMMDPKLVERFVQEARTIAQLNHPNIVTIFEVDEREDLHWFAMSYVAGRTLGQVMTEATEPLPIPVVRAWLYQIGDALGYAHYHNIVHRDIKPGNVLLDVRGNALVTDFGIAKVADVDAGLTRTGMLVGTPSCMSPEQCSSGKVTGASDQYSLGAVAYQMLTGAPPFTGPTLTVLQAHVMHQPRWVAELRPDCPEDLAAAVHRMLEKRPEDRWPSMSAAITGAGATPPGMEGPVREKLEMLAAQAAAITVSPWTDSVSEGTRKPLHVLVVEASGRILAGRRVEWSTTHDMVAAVSPDGALEAYSPGTAVLLASCGAATSTLQLTVEEDPVRAVEITAHSSMVPAGEQLPIEAIVSDLDGTPLGDRALVWASSDPAIARVSTTGMVEGINAGTVVITASTGGKSASVDLLVTPAAARAPAPSSGPRTGFQTMAPAAPTPAPGEPGLTRATVSGTAAPTLGGGSTMAQPVTRAEAVEAEPPKKRASVRGLGLLVGAAVLLSVVGIIVKGAGDRAEQTAATPPSSTSTDAPLATAPALPPVDSAAGGTVTTPPVAGPPASTDPRPSATPVRPAPQPTPQPRPVEQPPARTEGTIQIEGNLPQGAVVTVRSPSGETRTVTGSITLPAGTYALDFRAPNYEPDERTVTVVAGETRSWTPRVRAVAAVPPTAPPPTPPPVDNRAAEQAIGEAVRAFVGAFGRKDTNVVLPVLASDPNRDAWRQLLTNRDTRNFSAALSDQGPPQIDGDRATTPFSVRLAYRDQYGQQSPTIRFAGTLRRTADGWQLTEVRTVR